MTLSKVLCFFILISAACSPAQQEKPSADTLQQTKDTSKYADLFPFIETGLNKKNLETNGNYYMLTKVSDSTVKITWGNNTITRLYDETLDFMFAERLRVQWNNKDYLILRYGVGSGAWETVTLPINNKEPAQVFDNGLCFDSEYNLLGTEQFGDTVLTIQNLKTGRKQFITEKERPCQSVNNSACIDTISISNKTLYYKWVTPHTAADKKTTIEKRIRLTI